MIKDSVDGNCTQNRPPQFQETSDSFWQNLSSMPSPPEKGIAFWWPYRYTWFCFWRLRNQVQRKEGENKRKGNGENNGGRKKKGKRTEEKKRKGREDGESMEQELKGQGPVYLLSGGTFWTNEHWYCSGRGITWNYWFRFLHVRNFVYSKATSNVWHSAQ